MEINTRLVEIVREYLNRLRLGNDLSLRSTEKVLMHAVLVPQANSSFDNIVHGYQWLIGGIVVVKALFPINYRKLVVDSLTMEEIQEVFRLGYPIESDKDHTGFVINHVWATFLKPEEASHEQKWGDFFGRFGMGRVENPNRALRKIIQEYFENIRLNKLE